MTILSRVRRPVAHRPIPLLASFAVWLGGSAAAGGECVPGAVTPDPLPSRPVATYSIVARLPTGEFGVAVQSHWFSVGPIVPWAEPAVGAVATQSLVDVRYGPLGLDLMRAGKSADEALKALLHADARADVRQVAFIDSTGTVAVHTGENCIAEAGHVAGTAPDGADYACQSNLMRRAGVPEAMAAAFEAGGRERPLAERLVDALAAAERAGGDVRGRQSAALIVTRAQPTGRPWENRTVDLRVEDHADPVADLARLLNLHRAYERMNAGDLALEKADVEGAVREYNAARELAPHIAEISFWAGVSLAAAGREDDAMPLLLEAYKDQNADWRETLRRLPAAGILPDEPAMIERLTR